MWDEGDQQSTYGQIYKTWQKSNVRNPAFFVV